MEHAVTGSKSPGAEVFAHMEEMSKDPMLCNEELLLDMIKAGRGSRYGRDHGLVNVHTVDDFRRLMPLTSYDDYADYIDRLVQGEKYQLTCRDVVGFAETSGSVGHPKLIPQCAEALELYRRYGTDLTAYYETLSIAPGERKREMLLITYHEPKLVGVGIRCADISGLSIRPNEAYLRAYYTTPFAAIFAKGEQDLEYIQLRFALTERDMSGIRASFMSHVHVIFSYLINNFELLIGDIENGVIDNSLNIDQELRRELLKEIQPDPERADELRRIFSSGNTDGLIKRIWPNLSCITANGSAAFKPYADKVRFLCGDSVDFCHYTYGSSESLIGTITGLNDDSHALVPDAAFYEFIPVNLAEEAQPQTLLMDELEYGNEYELVLTTMSGFYRYRIGDIVRVVGAFGKTPKIRFSYRKKQLLNLVGEKTNELQLNWAVEQLALALGCHIVEYAAYPDLGGILPHYLILIEPDAPGLETRLAEISSRLDQKLGEANPDMLDEQSLGHLGRTEVRLIQPRTFAKYRVRMISRGYRVNQMKPVWLIDTPEKEQFFFEILDSESHEAEE